MDQAIRLKNVSADPVEQGLADYAAYFANLTEQNVGALDSLVTPDVRFSDPFNSVQGVQAMRQIFAATFRDCSDVRFQIGSAVRQGELAYLKWQFQFRPRRLGPGEPWLVDGVSELRFCPDGRVAEHIDHWDSGSQFYARLPLIGAVIRWLRGRIAAH